MYYVLKYKYCVHRTVHILYTVQDMGTVPYAYIRCIGTVRCVGTYGVWIQYCVWIQYLLTTYI